MFKHLQKLWLSLHGCRPLKTQTPKIDLGSFSCSVSSFHSFCSLSLVIFLCLFLFISTHQCDQTITRPILMLSGRFIASINQRKSSLWSLAGKSGRTPAFHPDCMFGAAARIFCRFTRRKCHLAQTGVASTDRINSPQSELGMEKRGGEGGALTLRWNKEANNFGIQDL